MSLVGSDDVIEFLVTQVAFRGDQGIPVSDFASLVARYHESEQQQQRDRFGSFETPIFDGQTVDVECLETLWKRFTNHPDIQIGKNGRVESLSLVEAIASSNIRIHVDSSRVWQTIAGHGVDRKRLPPLEWQLLSLIAAQGPEGIAQPELTRLSGQDKRSLPRRTDQLHLKGYIDKSAAHTRGFRTSLLKLKCYARAKDAQLVNAPKAAFHNGVAQTDNIIDVLFDTLRVVPMITFGDLRRRFGLDYKDWEQRTLFRFVRRLELLGCVKRVKATAKGIQKPYRCVKFVREPTEKDRIAVKTTALKKQSNLPSFDSDSDAQGEDGHSNLFEVQEVEGITGPTNMLNQQVEGAPRTPPQWDPDRHLLNVIFDIIHNAGIDGISSMDLKLKFCGPFWRRPLDTTMARLTDAWQESQPSHLKHLSIVRDTAVLGRHSHFIYRSYENMQQAVEAGITSWEAVGLKEKKKGKKAQQPSDTCQVDEYGFPKVQVSRLLGKKGDATLSECTNSLGRKSHQSCPVIQDENPSEGASSDIDPEVVDLPVQGQKRKADDAFSPRPKSPGRPLKYQRGEEPYRSRILKIQSKQIKWGGKLHGQAMEIARMEVLAKRKIADAAISDDGTESLEKQKTELQQHGADSDTVATQAKRIGRGRPPKKKVRMEHYSTKEPLHPGSVIAKLQADIKSRAMRVDAVRDQVVHREEPNTQGATQIPAPEQEASRFSENEQGASERRHKRPGISMGPGISEDEIPESRVREILEQMLDRSRPGLYIDPPDLKIERNTGSVGRPRKALILCVRSERLKDIDWFKAEAESVEVESSAEETPSVNQSVVLKAQSSRERIREATLPSLYRKGIRAESSRHAPVGLRGSPGIATEIVTDIDAHQNSMNIDPIQSSGFQEEGTRYMLVDAAARIDEYLNGPAESNPVRPVNSQLPEAETMDNDETQHWKALPELHEAQEQTQQQKDELPRVPADTLWYELRRPHSEDPQADVGLTRAQQGSKNATAMQQKKFGQQSWEGVRAAADDRSPVNGLQLRASARSDSEAESQEQSMSPARQTNAPEPMKFSSSEEHDNPHATSSQTKKKLTESRLNKGVQIGGGSIGHKRSKVILDIVNQSDGAFPGDREIWYPFATAWAKVNSDGTAKPDRVTVDRAVKNVVASGKLKRLTFAFRTRMGITITKQILATTDHPVDSPRVKELQKLIADTFPRPYLPPQVDVSEELRRKAEASLSRHSGHHETRWENEGDVLIDRPFAPEHIQKRLERAAQRQEKSYTGRRLTDAEKVSRQEARMQAQKQRLEKRQEARSQKQRRQEREVLQLEENIDSRQAQMQSDFKVPFYVHRPLQGILIPGQGHRAVERLKSLRDTQRPRPIAPAPFYSAPISPTPNTGSVFPQCRTADFSPMGSFYIDPAVAGSSALTPLPRAQQSVAYVLQRQDVGFQSQHHPLAHRMDQVPPSKAISQDLLGATQSFRDLFNQQRSVLLITRQSFYPNTGTLSTEPGTLDTLADQQPHRTSKPLALREQVTAASRKPSSDGGKKKNRVSTLRAFEDMYLQNGFARIPDYHPMPILSSKTSGKAPSPAAHGKATSIASQLIVEEPKVKPRRVVHARLNIPKEVEQRLLVAAVVVRTVAGGLERYLNWTLIARAMNDEYDKKFLKSRWTAIQHKHRNYAAKLQQEFQTKFPKAYESRSVPPIDFDSLETYDWALLVSWAQMNMDLPAFDSLPDLPAYRKTLDEQYELSEIPRKPDISDIREDFFTFNRSNAMRHEDNRQLPQVFTLPLRPTEAQSNTAKTAQNSHDLTVLKSWIRANVLTEESRYHPDLARRKLLTFSESLINEGLTQLLAEKVLRQENKGRLVPGRNYDITESYFSSFEKYGYLKPIYFQQAMDFKNALDTEFVHAGKETVNVSYHASEGEVLCLLNLSAGGRVALEPVIDIHNGNSAGPRRNQFTKWGFTDGHYKTRSMDRGKLHFPVRARRTASYIAGIPLQRPFPPIPGVAGNATETDPFDRPMHENASHLGMPDKKPIPLWIDIHGNFVESVWRLVLCAVLSCLAFRPGCGEREIARSVKGALGEWEVVMVTEWLVHVGVAKNVRAVGPAEGGWTLLEWWWAVLS